MSPTELNVRQRGLLAAFADVLIPGASGMPTPSAIGIAGKWLDRVLVARPDLTPVVTAVVEMLEDSDPISLFDAMRDSHPELLGQIGYMLAAAYLLHPAVKRRLGYEGPPRPHFALPDEAEVYLEDGILEPVLQRGPIFRQTPNDNRPLGQPG
jgi:hypothetical protein